MRPDTVCFDLGGVLVRICTDWNLILQGRGEQAQLSIDEPAIFAQFQTGLLDAPTYVKELASYLGVEEQHAFAAHQSILVEPYAGTLELVQDLEEAGLQTGCLSNTNELHWIEMVSGDRFPAIARLQFQVASHEVQLSKPDPTIFRHFESVCSRTPEQIMYFDDTETHVRAASELGWHAFQVDPQGDTSWQMRKVLQTFDLL